MSDEWLEWHMFVLQVKEEVSPAALYHREMLSMIPFSTNSLSIFRPLGLLVGLPCARLYTNHGVVLCLIERSQ